MTDFQFLCVAAFPLKCSSLESKREEPTFIDGGDANKKPHTGSGLAALLFQAESLCRFGGDGMRPRSKIAPSTAEETAAGWTGTNRGKGKHREQRASGRSRSARDTES